MGTTAETGYTIPGKNITFRWKGWKRNREGRPQKIFYYTTSKNYPRPISLKKNNRGFWKVREVSSIFVGPVKMPKKKQPDDDL